MLIKRIFQISPEFDNREEIILRDYLALERTKLANERTLLSYIRGSIYLVLGGIAFLQLKEFEGLHVLGYVSLSLSVIMLIVGVIRFIQLKQRLKKYYFNRKSEEQIS
jgi:putative membrane protein